MRVHSVKRRGVYYLRMDRGMDQASGEANPTKMSLDDWENMWKSGSADWHVNFVDQCVATRV